MGNKIKYSEAQEKIAGVNGKNIAIFLVLLLIFVFSMKNSESNVNSTSNIKTDNSIPLEKHYNHDENNQLPSEEMTEEEKLTIYKTEAESINNSMVCLKLVEKDLIQKCYAYLISVESCSEVGCGINYIMEDLNFDEKNIDIEYFCELIQDPKTYFHEENCKIGVSIFKGIFDYCEYNSECYKMVAINNRTIGIDDCDKLQKTETGVSSKFKKACYHGVAIRERDGEICTLLDSNKINSCFLDIALKERNDRLYEDNDISYCYNIMDSGSRDNCIQTVVNQFRESNISDRSGIVNEESYNECDKRPENKYECFLSNTSIPDGLVMYWKFNEGSGDIVNDYISYTVGDIYGATWVDGKIGKALLFNGDDYVRPPSHVVWTPDEVTFEVWVKPSIIPSESWGTITGSDIICHGHGGHWTLAFTHTGQFAFGVWNPDISWTTAYSEVKHINEWYHVVGTWEDNSHIRIYVNGELEEDVSVTKSLGDPGSGYPMSIGSYCQSDEKFFNGIIDEVAIYDEMLTDGKIQQHFENGINNLDYYS